MARACASTISEFGVIRSTPDTSGRCYSAARRGRWGWPSRDCYPFAATVELNGGTLRTAHRTTRVMPSRARNPGALVGGKGNYTGTPGRKSEQRRGSAQQGQARPVQQAKDVSIRRAGGRSARPDSKRIARRINRLTTGGLACLEAQRETGKTLLRRPYGPTSFTRLLAAAIAPQAKSNKGFPKMLLQRSGGDALAQRRSRARPTSRRRVRAWVRGCAGCGDLLYPD
jgi:hypothetical protein